MKKETGIGRARRAPLEKEEESARARKALLAKLRVGAREEVQLTREEKKLGKRLRDQSDVEVERAWFWYLE